MGVDRKSGDGETFREDDVGHLPPNAGQGGQLFEGLGDYPVKVGDQFAGTVDQVLGLVVLKAEPLDVGFNVFRLRGRQVLGQGETFKEGGSQLVDGLVG